MSYGEEELRHRLSILLNSYCYVEKTCASHPGIPYRPRLCMLYCSHRSFLSIQIFDFHAPVMTAVAPEAVVASAAALVAPVALPSAVS